MRRLALSSQLAALALVMAAVVPCRAAEKITSVAAPIISPRFRVSAEWRDAQGHHGTGTSVQLTSFDTESSYVWFFDPSNIEVVVKVVDACQPFGRIWVFAAGLTNVEVTLTVEDRYTGDTWQRVNPLGQPFQPILDTDAFTACNVIVASSRPGTLADVAATPREIRNLEESVLSHVGDLTGEQATYRQVSGDMVPAHPLGSVTQDVLSSPRGRDTETITIPQVALSSSRFLVSAEWRDPQGGHGSGTPVQLTADSAYFWFFDPSNVELVVKVLDACGPFNHFWVFAAGLTNVEVTLTVEDRLTGETWQRVNPLGRPFQPIQDTAAFATCGAVAPVCGQGTLADIGATPREDRNLEDAVLFNFGGLTANEDAYQRVTSDIARIHAQNPATQDVLFSPPFATDEVLLQPTPTAREEMAAGTYSSWDCLNRWYGVDQVRIEDSFVALHLNGVFDIRKVAEDYETLPGIMQAEPDFIGTIARDISSQICILRNGDEWHYFLDTGESFAHPSVRRIYEVTSEPGRIPQPRGDIASGMDPSALARFHECMDALTASFAP